MAPQTATRDGLSFAALESPWPLHCYLLILLSPPFNQCKQTIATAAVPVPSGGRDGVRPNRTRIPTHGGGEYESRVWPWSMPAACCLGWRWGRVTCRLFDWGVKEIGRLARGPMGELAACWDCVALDGWLVGWVGRGGWYLGMVLVLLLRCGVRVGVCPQIDRSAPIDRMRAASR